MARRRRRGSGSVFYSKTEGVWIARVSLGVRGGKRISHKARASSPGEAKRKLDHLMRIYAVGGTGEVSAMPLDEYLDDWLHGVKPTVRASTYTSYEGHVRLHISPLLGGIRVARLTTKDVRRLIDDRLAAGKSPTTIRRIITTLQMALNRGVREGDLTTNVVNGVRLPRAERHEITAMTDEQATRILDAVQGDEWETLYVLLLLTGLRLGEACALDWRDIDFDRGTVFVRSGKTRAAARTIPLTGEVKAALLRHRAQASRLGLDEPVFLGPRRGERLRGDVITHAFPRLLKRHGLPRMRVHDLRHGTATLLLAQGVPMRDIADLLGHSTPSVTMNVYAHVSEEMRRRSIATLEHLVATGDRVPERVPAASEHA